MGTYFVRTQATDSVTFKTVHIVVCSIWRNCRPIIREQFSAKRHSARDWLEVKTGSRRPETVQNQFVAVQFVRKSMQIDETKRNEMNCNELKRNEIDSVRCVAVHFVSFRFVSFRAQAISSMCIDLRLSCAPLRAVSRQFATDLSSEHVRNFAQQLATTWPGRRWLSQWKRSRSTTSSSFLVVNNIIGVRPNW